MSNKLRVILSCIHFPLSMASYFIRAFQRREDVELWTCGPYTGNWTPWAYGINVYSKHIHVPNFPLPKEMISTHLHPQMIVDKLPWIPDLFLQVDAGWHFSARPPGKVVALVETDPHVLKPTYALPKSYSDITFCMQGFYMADNEVYLPYGFDPTIHYPEEKEKIYDACLVGLLYPQRANLINMLRARNMKVYQSIGDIFDEYRDRYNESKIALSWSTLKDMPARVWEAFGMGLPLVTNRVPDLANFFVEGEHYLGFDTVDEGVHQTLRLLIDDDFRQTIADAGHRKVNGHSYDRRVQQILETCKLL